MGGEEVEVQLHGKVDVDERVHRSLTFEWER